MWAILYGKLGLSPAVARSLTWDEVDAYLYGYEWRRQEELAGHRMVATRIHNLFPGEAGALTEAQYHRLPLVDGPPPQRDTAKDEAYAAWKKGLAEENAKKLAAKAA